MFQFSGFPPHTLCIQMWVARHYSDGVSPFGHPRINTSVQLPWAFRCYRVLRRQLVPRHSSYTLFSFILVALSSARLCNSSSHAMRLSKSVLRSPLLTKGRAAKRNDTSRGTECQWSALAFLNFKVAERRFGPEMEATRRSPRAI